MAEVFESSESNGQQEQEDFPFLVSPYFDDPCFMSVPFLCHYEKPEKSLFVWTIDLQKLRKTPSGIFSLPGDLAEQSTKNLLYFCPTGLY